MTTILVCGGRNFQDKEYLFSALDDLCKERGWVYPEDELGNCLPNVVVVNGKAKGADLLSSDWAIINWCELKECPADWDKYGKAAGFIRNKQMLEEEKPDLVVAFPGGNGTKNMINIAKAAGVEVVEF